MKIAISCYPTYGGSGVVASDLALALAAAGDEVHVLSYAQPQRLTDAPGAVHFHRVEVREYPLFEYPPYSLALATKMVEVARRHRLDIVHVHYAVPLAVSAILARQIVAPQPLPVVTTLHGTDVTLVGNDPSYLETTRFSILQSDAVTTVSEWLRRTTLEQLDLDCAIDVVPNFVDPSRFAQSAPPRADRRPRLVHVSNLRRVKRVVDVVAVFERVRARMPAELIIVGEGPESAHLEEQRRKSPHGDDITLAGMLPEVEKVLRDADLLLLPSESESFGLAALEALACGVPVIATRAGGLPEVVRDGVDGLLYEVGDTEGMAAAALRLLGDPAEHARFAEQGRRRALESFQRQDVVLAYRRIYDRVLDRGDRRERV